MFRGLHFVSNLRLHLLPIRKAISFSRRGGSHFTKIFGQGAGLGVKLCTSFRQEGYEGMGGGDGPRLTEEGCADVGRNFPSTMEKVANF